MIRFIKLLALDGTPVIIPVSAINEIRQEIGRITRLRIETNYLTLWSDWTLEAMLNFLNEQ